MKTALTIIVALLVATAVGWFAESGLHALLSNGPQIGVDR